MAADLAAIHVHTIREHGAGKRSWVARVLGADPRYRFRRSFVRPQRSWKSAKRRIGGRIDGIQASYVLEEGWIVEVFEDSDPFSRRPSRYFAAVERGGLKRLSERDVVGYFT